MPLLGNLSISHKPISMFTSQTTQTSNVLIDGMATCNPLPVHYLFQNGLPSCSGFHYRAAYWINKVVIQKKLAKVMANNNDVW